jgi:CheY-like chemotaxis protein
MGDRTYFGGNGDGVPGWIRNEMKKDAFTGASILLIEDDSDIRELMATLLRLAGFEPTVCSNAEFGLQQLREQTFDMVLTDYALPNRNGAWLIQQANAEGLLDATPVLVVTAHPDPPDLDGYEIICKPFDLDDLVGRVKQHLEGVRRADRGRTPASKSRRPGDDGGGDCPDPIELILYVSRYSPKSAAAVANIKQVLSRFKSSRVRLTIHDLSETPSAGAADSVTFTPTLVKRSPGPRTFILGHINNPEILVELIEACGEDAN